MRRLAGLAVLLAILAPLPVHLLAGEGGSAAWPLRNSLLAALAASLAATLLGTAAGIALRGRFAGHGLVAALIALPLILPAVIPGAALLLVAQETGWGAGWPGMALWQATLGAPLVAALVGASLRRVDPALLRAAEACGATPAQAVQRLLRPRLWPAALAGAALVFALSVGESGLAVLLGAETLPAASLPGGAAPGSPLAWPLVAAALAAALFLRPLPDRG